LIYLLEGIKLLNVKDLSRFIRELKGQVEKKYLDFTLYSNDESTIVPLKKFLEKKF
jgi:myosin-crossreactive antigen